MEIIIFMYKIKLVTNPNCQFHCVAINGDLLGLIIHSNCALHVLIEFILSESQKYAEKYTNSNLLLRTGVESRTMNCIHTSIFLH